MFTKDMAAATNPTTDREVTMSAFIIPSQPMVTTGEFAAETRGLLAAGTLTSRGTIAGRSFTAYEMEDGSYVPFSALHANKAAEPLVVFG